MAEVGRRDLIPRGREPGSIIRRDPNFVYALPSGHVVGSKSPVVVYSNAVRLLDPAAEVSSSGNVAACSDVPDIGDYTLESAALVGMPVLASVPSGFLAADVVDPPDVHGVDELPGAGASPLVNSPHGMVSRSSVSSSGSCQGGSGLATVGNASADGLKANVKKPSISGLYNQNGQVNA